MIDIPDPGGTYLEDRFSIITAIGKGAYGSVFKAIDNRTGDLVALKKVHIFDSSIGPPVSFYREERALSTLKHKNIVAYKGTVMSRDNPSLYIVLQYCEYELGSLIHSFGKIPIEHAKSFMYQILCGLHEMHKCGYMHLDIKPANIFVTANGEVKIGDFGLTRCCSDSAETQVPTNVVTLAYRSPEILLQDRTYSHPVDIWSLACVFYQMATGKVLFGSCRSFGDDGLLNTIFEICGTPTSDEWPELYTLPKYSMYLEKHGTKTSCLNTLLQRTLPREFAGLQDLLESMLVCNPGGRISAEEAMMHPFFSDIPEPHDLPLLVLPEMHGHEHHFAVSKLVRPPERASLRLTRTIPSLVSCF